jgi:ArsR family transcriptional regulator
MARTPLTKPVIERLAQRLRALGEPSRITILAALRTGARSVSQLIDDTGLGQANVSKHLNVLHQHGYVIRRKEGLNVFYELSDNDVFRICDIVCGRLEREAQEWSGLLQAGARPAARAAKRLRK